MQVFVGSYHPFSFPLSIFLNRIIWLISLLGTCSETEWAE
ncbi:hypothetical protein B4167_3068 [Caldibacillus thermoamylovorans]|uniref:Uncharacterized protein n=1 Tax=Caldibacillus thermoamylovorans TaxID=35841 RepID=A0ABD4A5G8_9BACI|nr:hypothetical protein B4167_3068 [Caldibacillus thermoamylovorans]